MCRPVPPVTSDATWVPQLAEVTSAMRNPLQPGTDSASCYKFIGWGNLEGIAAVRQLWQFPA